MLRLDDFMGQALSQYYDSRDPLGVNGDFTTAPEISQLFGEIIGVWAVQKWMSMGSPSSIKLIEIGPGRGTLMNDLLRATKHIPNFHAALSIHLIETSSTLKSKQQETLKDYKVEWHTHLSKISNNEDTIIIANEFLDALPIRQFKFHNNEWLEHYIDGKQSVWQEIRKPPIKTTLPAPHEGNIFEYSQSQQDYADIISTFKGVFLTIDYGYRKSAYGNSLQALYKHESCDITRHVGQADLTSHIDFEWLSQSFKNSTIKTQREFLKENGIDIRYQSLNNSILKSGYDRLLDFDKMGELFKVLEVQMEAL